MNTLKNTCFVGFLIVSTTVLSPVCAQVEELPARGPIPFAAYDKDGNGFVSEGEFNAIRAQRMSTRAAEGRPMRGAGSAPAFSTFDSNNDGQLTQDELATGQKAQMEKRRSMGMGQGRGMGKGMQMGRNMPAFSDFDLDGDGKLVETEFNEARNKRITERAQQGYQMRNLANAPAFADIDTNGNGEISAEEFAAHQSLRRQKGTQ